LIAGAPPRVEEDASGWIRKTGDKRRNGDVLTLAEHWVTGAALSLMDTFSASAECVGPQRGLGRAKHGFPISRGNATVNPTNRVITVAAHRSPARHTPPRTVFDLSGLVRGEMTVDETGERLLPLGPLLCDAAPCSTRQQRGTRRSPRITNGRTLGCAEGH
jgi:(2R)-sulfolactate sulfo-lyase subunit beta